MNVELMKSVAIDIRDDLSVSGLPAELDSLRQQLKTLNNSPQDGNASQQVAALWASLQEKLATAPSNFFTPVWKSVAESLGAWDITGNRLLEQLAQAFQENKVTYPTLFERVREINGQVALLAQSIEQFLGGVEGLGVGQFKLSTGEAELSMLIPRAAVKNELGALTKELRTLNSTFRVFTEREDGTRSELKIRTVSASDFTVLLDVAPQAAAMIAEVVRGIITAYETIKKLREMIADILGDPNVPNTAADSLLAAADSEMNAAIERLVPEIMDKYFPNAERSRKQELRVDISTSCKRTASRIDRQYSFGVRIGPPPPESEEGEAASEENRELIENIEVVQDAAPTLQFKREGGEPILKLTDGTLSSERNEEEDGAT